MQKSIPKISVNKIPDFVNATEKGKRAILRMRKFPEDNKVRCNMYNSVKSTIARYIKDDDHDTTVFLKKIEELQKKEPKTDWQKKDNKNSIEVLKELDKNHSKLLKPFLLYHAEGCVVKEMKAVNLNGVTIDLNPDILLYEKNGGKLLGGIKLYITKSKALTPMSGEIIAGLIQKRMAKLQDREVDSKNVAVIDVFHSKIVTAPQSFNYHTKYLKSACNDIIKMWDKITREKTA